MEKEIKITITQNGETEEIITNCAMIVAMQREGVSTQFLAKGKIKNYVLHYVLKATIMAVYDAYEKLPEIKVLRDLAKSWENGENEKEEEIVYDGFITPSLDYISLNKEWEGMKRRSKEV